MIFNLRHPATCEVTTISESAGQDLEQYTSYGWEVEEAIPEDDEEEEFMQTTGTFWMMSF